MKDPNNFILFIILFATFANFNNISAFSSAELEKNLILIDNLSKISQIKRIENEIEAKAKIATSRNGDISGVCDTKLKLANDMKINTDMLIKGEVSTFNIFIDQMLARDNTEIKHILTSEKISSNTIESQSVIVENISSPTVSI